MCCRWPSGRQAGAMTLGMVERASSVAGASVNSPYFRLTRSTAPKRRARVGGHKWFELAARIFKISRGDLHMGHRFTLPMRLQKPARVAEELLAIRCATGIAYVSPMLSPSSGHRSPTYNRPVCNA